MGHICPSQLHPDNCSSVISLPPLVPFSGETFVSLARELKEAICAAFRLALKTNRKKQRLLTDSTPVHAHLEAGLEPELP